MHAPSGDPDIHLPLFAELYSFVDNPSSIALNYGEGTLYSELLFEKYNLEVPFESDNTCVKPHIDQRGGDLILYKQIPAKDDPVYYALEPWQGFKSSCYDLNPKPR